jgi:hypothetical protein
MAAQEEKYSGTTAASPSSPSSSSVQEGMVTDAKTATAIQAENAMQRWANRIDRIAGVEARGIARVPEDMRERPVAIRDYLHMFTIWFSMNCTANQMTLGILGPVAYGLSLTDSIV